MPFSLFNWLKTKKLCRIVVEPPMCLNEKMFRALIQMKYDRENNVLTHNYLLYHDMLGMMSEEYTSPFNLSDLSDLSDAQCYSILLEVMRNGLIFMTLHSLERKMILKYYLNQIQRYASASVTL